MHSASFGAAVQTSNHGYVIAALLLFAAEASECSSEFWRWQESATGGGLSAPGAAGVSTELCD